MDWLWFVVVAIRGVSPDPDDRWATRLAALDQERAAAFAEADPGRLRAVYVAGSRAERADAASIRDWSARGGAVNGAQMRVLRCRVVSASGSRVELVVVDQLARAHVVWRDGSRTDLPRDRPTRRVVTLVRASGGWRVGGTAELTGRSSSRR